MYIIADKQTDRQKKHNLSFFGGVSNANSNIKAHKARRQAKQQCALQTYMQSAEDNRLQQM